MAWLLATVLLVLAVVLSLTLVLLPVGLLLGYAAFRLYKLGVRLAMPRAHDVKKGVQKEARRWRREITPRRRRRKPTPFRRRRKPTPLRRLRELTPRRRRRWWHRR